MPTMTVAVSRYSSSDGQHERQRRPAARVRHGEAMGRSAGTALMVWLPVAQAAIG